MAGGTPREMRVAVHGPLVRRPWVNGLDDRLLVCHPICRYATPDRGSGRRVSRWSWVVANQRHFEQPVDMLNSASAVAKPESRKGPGEQARILTRIKALRRAPVPGSLSWMIDAPDAVVIMALPATDARSFASVVRVIVDRDCRTDRDRAAPPTRSMMHLAIKSAFQEPDKPPGG
jgi:hypothetical protein